MNIQFVLCFLLNFHFADKIFIKTQFEKKYIQKCSHFMYFSGSVFFKVIKRCPKKHLVI